MAETQFRRSMQLSEGDPGIFISTPFTIITYLLMLVALGWPWINKAIKKFLVKN
jgi:putative tricarboxylic transport membrane protein